MTASEDAAGQSADIVRGWEAAAEVAGRSVAGMRKLVADGRLVAQKAPDGAHVFARADLLALPRVVRATDPDAVFSAIPNEAAVDGTPSESHESPASSTNSASATRGASLAGELAAAMFAEFAAGRTPVEVVVSLKQSPETVESTYEAWRRMKALDTTSTEARGRIAELEAALQAVRGSLDTLTAVVDAHDPVIAEASNGVSEQRQAIENLLQRTAALERARFDGQAELRGLRQRLAAVEQAVRALPGAPIAIGVPCAACGQSLAVAASCTGCGAGCVAVR